MEEHRQRHQRRWLASLGPAALRQRAIEQGVQIGDGEDQEVIIDRLLAVESGASPASVPQSQGYAAGQDEVAAPVAPQNSEPAATLDPNAQMLADEEMARQLQADEELAQQLQAEEDGQPPAHSDSVDEALDSSGAPHAISADRVAEALEILAPLRATRRRFGGETGNMIDSVLQQLEAHMAAGRQPSTSSSGAPLASASAAPAPPGPSMPHISSVTAATSGPMAQVAAALAAAAALQPVAPALQPVAVAALDQNAQILADEELARQLQAEASTQESQPVPSMSLAPSVQPVASAASAAADEVQLEDSATSTSEPVSHSDRFATYMARVEARRTDSRRRREDRLQQLNIALDHHMQVFGITHEDAPPAGDPEFVEAHSSTSVWSGSDDTQCVICVEDLVDGDSVRSLPCGHVYHKECIDLWLERSRLCCLCKRPIDAQPSNDSGASSSNL